MKSFDELEKPITVAFQGAAYAFSEIAAKKFFGDQIQSIPCKNFEDVFQAVEEGKSIFGIVPVENSLTGSIHRNYDLLLEKDLKIVGEHSLRVEQHLIASPGVSIDEINTIYSHPQALEQCRKFLSSLNNIKTVASYDTAGSVKMVRDKGLKNAAAIASKNSAEDYGMQILRKEIEDIPENYTRFLIICKKSIKIGDPDKTSIVFAMKNIPGALFKSLSVFALRDIDLIRVESRPLRGKPWDYFFYIDFKGHMEEERCNNAIRHLQEIALFIKVLGSFKAGQNNTSV